MPKGVFAGESLFIHRSQEKKKPSQTKRFSKNSQTKCFETVIYSDGSKFWG